MDEFLKTEYEGCLDLLKHYDERHLSLVKFATAVSNGAVTLIFGFYALSSDTHSHFWYFAAALSGTAAIGLLTIFAAMVQNRLYFIYPARQVNAIRRAMLGSLVTEFSDNQMYLTTDVRPFKFLSMHTLMNFLVALQVGVFLAFSWFAMTVNFADVTPSIVRALIGAAFATVLVFGLSAMYLIITGRHHPDRAVHLVKEQEQ